jgi:hypothetical protein
MPRRKLFENILTKEQLEHDYFVLGLGRDLVARKHGVNEHTISRYLKLHNIEVPKELRVPSARIRKLILSGVDTLTDRQHSILIGSILGDSSIGKMKNTKNGSASISFWQGCGRKAYLDWKAEELAPFAGPVRKAKNFEDSYYFETVRYKIFNKYYDMFRSNGPKDIPKDIEKHLDELALAVWFQDDGHTAKSYSEISTNGFTFPDCELLVQVLKNRFSLDAKVRNHREKGKDRVYPILRFNVVAHHQLHKIIDSLFHSCFEYKKDKGSSETNTQSSPIRR